MKDNLSSYSSNDYDERINLVLPFYSQFHNQILDLVNCLDLKNISWLDTGCGTGNLGVKIMKNFNNVKLTLSDPSQAMLKKAEEKLGIYENISFYNLPSEKIEFNNEFDVITAVQAHHYLNKAERITATKKCFNALKSGGIFITFENIKPSTELSEIYGLKRWERYLRSKGKTDEEIKSHMARRGTEVLPITIEEHLCLLIECGFKSADILWTSYMQAGFFAIKE